MGARCRHRTTRPHSRRAITPRPLGARYGRVVPADPSPTERCAEPGCTAAAPSHFSHCIAHLDGAGVQKYVTRLADGEALLARGTTLPRDRLSAWIERMPVSDGKPRVTIDAKGATFPDGVVLEDVVIGSGSTLVVRTSVEIPLSKLAWRTPIPPARSLSRGRDSSVRRGFTSRRPRPLTCRTRRFTDTQTYSLRRPRSGSNGSERTPTLRSTCDARPRFCSPTLGSPVGWLLVDTR